MSKSNESDSTDLFLGDFIDQNDSLFVVLGVFAALSVYVSQLPADGVEEEYIQLGLVSSLLITGLIVLAILRSFLEWIDPNRMFRLKNMSVNIFVIAHLTLLYSLYRIVTKETTGVAIIGIFVVVATILVVSYELYIALESNLVPIISYEPLRKSASALTISVSSHFLFPKIRKWMESELVLRQLEDVDNAIEFLPTLIYQSLRQLSEITTVAIFYATLFTVVFTMSVLENKYRIAKDLIEDH